MCTILRNQQQKLTPLPELKENLKKYDYPVIIITHGIKKPLENPQNVRTTPLKNTFEDTTRVSAF